ncbi:hypothetical protein [Bacteroides sp. UBA939]|uniref:hypothetical protein n=1 Tax=Bacteroides sp. UBA939 TaxID=1946092 RepID=UPI0025B880A3|nr:hypothetical protein [Bacteroides sp. UBA939]
MRKTRSEWLLNGLFLPDICGFCMGYMWFAHHLYAVRARDICGSHTGYYRSRSMYYGSRGKQTVIA